MKVSWLRVGGNRSRGAACRIWATDDGYGATITKTLPTPLRLRAAYTGRDISAGHTPVGICQLGVFIDWPTLMYMDNRRMCIAPAVTTVRSSLPLRSLPTRLLALSLLRNFVGYRVHAWYYEHGESPAGIVPAPTKQSQPSRLAFLDTWVNPPSKDLPSSVSISWLEHNTTISHINHPPLHQYIQHPRIPALNAPPQYLLHPRNFHLTLAYPTTQAFASAFHTRYPHRGSLGRRPSALPSLPVSLSREQEGATR